MSPAFLLTFRESLEAAMIVGILLATLKALGQQKKNIFVWGGVGVGVMLSIIFSEIFEAASSELEGKMEVLYEGILMLFAVALITHLIFWMQKYGKTVKPTLQKRVSDIVMKKELWMLAVIACLSVAREGMETVVFMEAASVQSGNGFISVSAILGIFAAVLLAVIIFWSSSTVSPKRFFQITTFLLIFVSAGLAAHAVMEFQEINLLPTAEAPIYDLTSVLSDKQGAGSILRALFGYDANPSLLALVVYCVYLTGMFAGLKRQVLFAKKA